jgi:type IV pilus assembly protein PilM
LELGPVRRLDHWLGAMPHPLQVVEIAPDHVAAARWKSARGHLESFAVEYLTKGSVIPSPVEPNIARPDQVRSALRRVFERSFPKGTIFALLIPDPAVRVFILPFDNFPRGAEEALPLLRWRLKKSVPFDVDETVVSWMRQTGRHGSLEIVAAVARQRIIREYEEILESAGGQAGVVLSSTLSSIPLLESGGATLFVRLCGRTLTTVIVRSSALCVYRSSELNHDAATLDPQAVLDEVFPALAYDQDTWGTPIDRVRIAGLGDREEVFRRALAEELKCPIGPVSATEGALGLDVETRGLLDKDMEPLAGWVLNRGF